MDVLDEQDEQTAEGEAPDDATKPETEDGKDYADDFSNLAKERVEQLKGLCHKFDQRDQWARMIEILRVTLLRFFWVGLQHVSWNADLGQYQIGQSGVGQVVREDMNEESTFAEDFNIFTGYGKSFIAVFAQNAAPVRMEPDEAKDDRSIEASEEAQKFVRIYEKYNPPKVQQIDIGRLFWTDGRVLSHTRYVESKAKYGCDKDGNPRGQEETEFYGVLESKVPIYETDFEKWPYCRLSKDHDVSYLKEKHSEFADEIAIGSKTSSPNEEIARMSRIATAENVTQLSQDTLKYLVTEDKWWLRPCAFRELEDDDREFWQELFPDGCQVTFCGDTYVGARAEAMDDHLNVVHAMPGTGQSRPSLGNDEVPVQMEFNDAMNLAAECLKYAIPSIWADMDEVTARAIMEQNAQYGAFRPFKSTRTPSEPLENLFFPEPTTEPPAMFVEWLENLQGPLSQFVTSQQPALFGANMEDQKTARGYQMARDQALGLMLIVWVPFKNFYARICQQAAQIRARRKLEGENTTIAAVVSAGAKKTETITVDVAKMRGGFVCSPAIDENFPESWTQKSNKITGLMQAVPTNPVLGKILMHPDNMVLVRDMGIGIEEFVIPDADSRDKQIAEWAEMIQNETGPVDDPIATQTRDQKRTQMAQQAVATLAPGQPAPPLPQLPPVQKSSVPIDVECDNHTVEAEECLRILNSPEGQRIKQATPEIWQDLKLHFLAHKAAAAAQAPPPMPAAPPMKHPAAGAPAAGGVPPAAAAPPAGPAPIPVT